MEIFGLSLFFRYLNYYREKLCGFVSIQFQIYVDYQLYLTMYAILI